MALNPFVQPKRGTGAGGVIVKKAIAATFDRATRTISGTSDPDNAIDIRIDGVVVARVRAGTDGSFSYTFVDPIAPLAQISATTSASSDPVTLPIPKGSLLGILGLTRSADFLPDFATSDIVPGRYRTINGKIITINGKAVALS